MRELNENMKYYLMKEEKIYLIFNKVLYYKIRQVRIE